MQLHVHYAVMLFLHGFLVCHLYNHLGLVATIPVLEHDTDTSHVLTLRNICSETEVVRVG